MKVAVIRSASSRMLLGIAYLSCTLQWLWVMTIGLPPLIETGSIDFLLPTAPVPDSSYVQAQQFSPLMLVFAGIITVAMLVFTAIVLYRLPKTVAKVSHNIVHETTDIILPFATHHKKIPAKKKQALSRRIVLITQIAASLLPLLIAFFLAPYGELSKLLIVIVALFFAAVSVSAFVLSWLLKPTKTTSRTRSHASRG